jgi:hypothetical protein
MQIWSASRELLNLQELQSQLFLQSQSALNTLRLGAALEDLDALNVADARSRREKRRVLRGANDEALSSVYS